MKGKILRAAAAITIAAMPLGGMPSALAQSTTGEAKSHGIAGGDSFGSEGSARGGNGPSQTGIQASGGVAGGNPPSKGGNISGIDAMATGSISSSGPVTVTADDEVELTVEEKGCGSGDRLAGSCEGNGQSGE